MSKKSLNNPKHSTNKIFDTMQHLLEKAKTSGATEAMVYANYDQGFAVDVRMQEVDTIAFHENKGIKLVVYVDKCKGSASSSDFSLKALDNLANIACDIAKFSAPDPCFGLPDPQSMKHDYPTLDLEHPWSINPEEAIKKALSCEKYALSLDKRIQNSDGVHISTYNYYQSFANSYGYSGLLNSTRHSISCSLIAKNNSNMQRDYDYTTALNAENLTPIELLAQNAVKNTVNRLGAQKLKTQKSPVIFTSRVSYTLFSHFINAISGANLYKKNSFLLDSLGKTIFPANFKIYEQPYLKMALGSSPFDGEGLPTRNNIFVEDGKLCEYVLNSYTARRLGLTTTANANGVHNLTIAATDNNLASLIKQMNKGLVVTELMGQGLNILTGDYSRGAIGFWVENGIIQYPVEEITIAGNLKNMFKMIVDVGNDINPNIATRCGSVLISEMTIAGN